MRQPATAAGHCLFEHKREPHARGAVSEAGVWLTGAGMVGVCTVSWVVHVNLCTGCIRCTHYNQPILLAVPESEASACAGRSQSRTRCHYCCAAKHHSCNQGLTVTVADTRGFELHPLHARTWRGSSLGWLFLLVVLFALCMEWKQ
jgi:hypothetical protein